MEIIESDQRREPPAMCGGAAQQATAVAMQNQHIADEVQAAARRAYLGEEEKNAASSSTKTTSPFDRYIVTEMLTQVVAGTNYFFRVQIADAEFIHLRVFSSLFGDMPELVALKKGADAAGPLAYFDADSA